MPRKKVPDNVKHIRGTFVPCRAIGDAEFDLLENPPEAPQWLDHLAAEYWERVVPVLMDRNVLTVLDLEALAVLCMLYGRVRRASQAGVDIPGNIITQLRLYQAEFGITPASKPRVTPGQKNNVNRFSRPKRKPK